MIFFSHDKMIFNLRQVKNWTIQELKTGYRRKLFTGRAFLSVAEKYIDRVVGKV